MARIKGVKGIRLRVRVLPSGHKRQYLDIHEDGKRRTEKVPGGMLTGNPLLDKAAKTRADEYLKQRIRDFDTRHGINRVKQARKSFLEYCEKLAEERIPKTRATWCNTVKHLRDFAGDGCTFANLDRQFFEGLKHHLTAKLSPGTAWLYFSVVKTAIHRAVDEGIIDRDPSAEVTIRRRNGLPVHLSLEEVRKLSETPCGNESVKAAFLFSCFTGLRYSDVKQLTWDKIRGGYLEFDQKKTGEAERMPLSEEAQRILDGQKGAGPSRYLSARTFPKNQVFFLPSWAVMDGHIKAWAKAAGIEKPMSFHKSRHSFATLALAAGVDLYTVSKLMGHKSLAMTQVYAKVIDEKKKQAVGMLPTLKR